MHVPNKWQFPSEQEVVAFIDKYAFATIVTSSLESTRLPVVFNQKTKKLEGHFARANPHWKSASNAKCLIMFDGPHSYISPSWYRCHPAVPTWNYASVHITGHLSLLNPGETLQTLYALINKYEPELNKVNEIMPMAHQQKLLKGIVGFSIEIDQIKAKAKLGQHRAIADQEGVVNGLSNCQSAESEQLLSLMKQWQLGVGR